MTKKLRLFIIFIIFSTAAFAEVRFANLSLSADNQLLFRAEAESPGFGEYSTGFAADLTENSMEQLTFFPEEVVLVDRGRMLQFHNRFGVFRSDNSFENIAPIENFPSFINGEEVETGKIYPIIGSPDGDFLCYLVPVSDAFANLVLFEVETAEETVVSRNIELSLDEPPVTWSPNSQYFVYAKNRELYYFSLSQLEEQRIIAEEFRHLGEGTVASVEWNTRNELYYLQNDLVYKIHPAQLFTRSLYAGFLNIGEVIGKLPFPFDPNFDHFRISSDGTKILLNRDSRNLFLYYLSQNDYQSNSQTRSLPYLFLPRNTTVEQILWSDDDIITVLTKSIENGDRTSAIYRLTLDMSARSLSFSETDDEGVEDIVLSPDQDYAVLIRDNGISLKDYETWEYASSFEHPQPLHAVWKNSTELLVSGRYYTELIDTDSLLRETVCLSQASQIGYDSSANALINVNSTMYQANLDDGSVSLAAEAEIQTGRVASNEYRVYLNQLSTGSYQNLVMVRSITGYGTEPLFPRPERQYEDFPEEDDQVNLVNFSHGSRIRRREVALVFNAIDSAQGVTTILNTLNEYDIRATFFINGDFIQRNPGAVIEISESGHEIGSLFFSYFNMTDSRFSIDSQFIMQGLARNEDEYFNLTGRELSLLWHAPFYFVNSEIIQASREMNYVYVGRDIDSLDWVSSTDCSAASTLYMPTAQLIERIMSEKQPGSIIPIRIGVPEGGRSDYLFQRLEVLINGLISHGYSIVPVSTLVDHAQ